jgi:hypothetical protein
MLRAACCIDMLRVAESFLNTVLEIGGARKSMARSPYLSPYRDYPYPYCDFPYPHRGYPYPSSRLSVPLSRLSVPLSRLSVPLLWLCAGWHWPGCRSTRRRRRRRSSARTPGARSTRSAPRRRGPPERTAAPPMTPRRLRPTHTVGGRRTCARLHGRHCSGNWNTGGDGTRAPRRRRARASMPCVSCSARLRPRVDCSTSAPGLRAPLPHLRRDWAHRCHIGTGTGLTPSHICTGTGLTSAPGLGLDRRPHLRRDSGCWLAQVRSWAATPKVLGAFRK